VVALDDALNGLAQLDEQQGCIVELRFFGGLTTEEIAQVLDILPPQSNATGMWQKRG
jgi:DNA-directed RNA polymerase specialized sigma24 family protein